MDKLNKNSTYLHIESPSKVDVPGGKIIEEFIGRTGKMHIKMDAGSVTLNAGEVFLSKKGVKVQYSNPFEDKNEYWAVCIPAFSVDMAGR